MVITTTHADTKKFSDAYQRINTFLSELKATATQLTFDECRRQITTKSIDFFIEKQAPIARIYYFILLALLFW